MTPCGCFKALRIEQIKCPLLFKSGS
uniref:Uncharacterized protein n=1 Tax=Anguilla anguilla TaxID=7936 RepID=A0A0E9SLJ8_ANGAN